jgi:parvulin-like peptidyl-prolyl isomerase
MPPLQFKRFAVLLPLFLGLALAVSPPAARAEEDVLDAMAAVVNGDVITFSEVREIVGPRIKSLHAQYPKGGKEYFDKVTAVRLEALNDLIDRQLILQEFDKNKFSIPDYIVDEQVAGIIRQDFGGDRAAFLRTLEAQGFTIEKFRKNEKEKIIVQAMRQKNVPENLIIPPRKVEEYYDQHKTEFTTQDTIHLRMLVLKKDASSLSESSEKMAEEIREKIMGGADFGKMAAMYSEDASQGAQGDWGWVDRHTLNETLTKAAFDLKAGQVSKPLELEGNIYLLYVQERKDASVHPLKEVRDDIEKKLLQEMRQEQQEKWIASLRKKAYIKYY